MNPVSEYVLSIKLPMMNRISRKPPTSPNKSKTVYAVLVSKYSFSSKVNIILSKKFAYLSGPVSNSIGPNFPII